MWGGEGSTEELRMDCKPTERGADEGEDMEWKERSCDVQTGAFKALNSCYRYPDVIP